MEKTPVNHAYYLLKLAILDFFQKNQEVEMTSSKMSKQFGLITKSPRGLGQNRISLELLETLTADGFLMEKTEKTKNNRVKRRLYRYHNIHKTIPEGWIVHKLHENL